MKVSYVKKSDPPEGPPKPPVPEHEEQEEKKVDVDWEKLGYTKEPEGKEDFKPTQPDVVPSTLPDQGPKQLSPLHDPIEVSEKSTFIHQQIQSKKEAYDWVLSMLGYPLVTAELNESHLNTAFANAIQTYTEYAYFPEQYIMEYTANYEYGPGKGFNLEKYNVSDVREVCVGHGGVMFYDWPFFMNRAGYQGSGTLAGSFITYHNMVEFHEMVKRLTARDYDFTYSRRTKYLTLFPQPPPPPPPVVGKDPPMGLPVVLTVHVEPPLHELYGDIIVRRLALAWAKIILGQIRGKFEGVTLPGGGNVSKEIGGEGKEELEKLEEKLKTDRSQGQDWFFV